MIVSACLSASARVAPSGPTMMEPPLAHRLPNSSICARSGKSAGRSLSRSTAPALTTKTRPSLGDKAADVAGCLGRTRPRGDVDLWALGPHRGARQRHPVLPTVEPGDSNGSRIGLHVVDAQTVTIAVGPHHPFAEGGLELAVYADDANGRIDCDERAVDRTTRLGAFRNAQVHENA